MILERSTRNSAVYSSKEFGSLIVTAWVPKGRKRKTEYDIEVPDELVEGEG